MGESQVQEPTFGTVDSILAAPDVGSEEMFIPEWGCKIRIQGLTQRQRGDIRVEATRDGQPIPEIVTLLMFIEGVREPKFERMHFGQLQEKASGVVDRVVDRITTLSGMTEEDRKRMMARFPG